MNKQRSIPISLYYAAILISSAILFIPFLGQVHLFDWDEINFAESAREMIASHDFMTVQINYIPFWEKPPLFIWMQVLSMKTFGISEFAARLPNAICGILTLLLLFHLGRKMVDFHFGLTWTALYGGSLLPFLYFKSGIIDPWFNLFIFLGIYSFYRFASSDRNRIICLGSSAMFIGLAVLTKGPVALLVFLLTCMIWLIIHKFKIKIRMVDILLFIIILTVVGGFWFILQIIKGNFGIIADFIEYQVRLFRTHGAGHRGFLFYHFVVLLLGVFPASLLALPALFSFRIGEKQGNDFRIWMLILFWAVLILFTIVKTKIVHYSSLCYFPLTFISAWYVYNLNGASVSLKKWIRFLVVLTGLVLSLLIAVLAGIEYYKDEIITRGLIKDPFAIECLKANGGWSGYESVVSLILLAGIVLFAIYWLGDRLKAVYMLCGSVAAFMFLAMYLITPGIEGYSQRTAVEFFKTVSSQDSYKLTLGYKSYAHLFYGKVKNSGNMKSRDEKWLLSGDIDKPVFISAKSYNAEKYMAQYPDLFLLYKKNGFVFFKRFPKSIHDK